jgi:hypothetical protein
LWQLGKQLQQDTQLLCWQQAGSVHVHKPQLLLLEGPSEQVLTGRFLI